jgi:hypothetical protein
MLGPLHSHVAGASGERWRENNVDFTGAMMVLALKLISAGVSYQDGLQKPEVCFIPVPTPCRSAFWNPRSFELQEADL